MFDCESFLENGYVIADVDDIDTLSSLREEVKDFLGQYIDISSGTTEHILNNIHKHNMPSTQINDIRLGLVNKLSVENNYNKRLYNMFSNVLSKLVGVDVLGQKRANFSIQVPNDSEIIPIHRDAPENSQFEVVVWIPLVDVYETKSLFMLSREDSLLALNILRNEQQGYSVYSKFCESNGKHIKVPYGKAICFQPSLAHGCKINVEQETRWSINIRYKSLFAPCGLKNPFEFYDIINLSPLSKLAIEAEKNELVFYDE